MNTLELHDIRPRMHMIAGIMHPRKFYLLVLLRHSFMAKSPTVAQERTI